MSIHIAALSAEHHHSGFAISHRCPRLSWRFSPTTVKGWRQASYTLVVVRSGGEETYQVKSSASILVPWPSSSLRSREAAQVRVCVTGEDGSTSPWATLNLEAALLSRSDWACSLISARRNDGSKRPFRLRKQFTSPGKGVARLYASAHGLYQVEINGKVVGDELLAPGWQSYHDRLHYQTYDVTPYLVDGENVIGAYVAEGWYAGRLGRPGTSGIWGERCGFLGQLEVDGQVVCATDSSWQYVGDGPVVAAEVYNGETFDTMLDNPAWSTVHAQIPFTGGLSEELPFPSAALLSPDVAPVRRIAELKPQQLIRTPSGKMILDFGQNLVGWLKFLVDVPGSPGDQVVIRHAEVLENQELGIRPLRTAKAQTIIKLGGRTKGYETRFSWYGFRYAEITGYPNLKLSDVVAVLISSDLRRTGTFDCSHQLINQLHRNTVASTHGNFVSLPTDCPQRDERLGWTGDIAVFAPTANYLFDTSAFLGAWLEDLAADQRRMDGVVPVVIPRIPMARQADQRSMAIWADACITVPWNLYEASGDQGLLSKQWDSMRMWLDRGVPRNKDGFYSDTVPQYGDWLDPKSPPQLPGHGRTDPFFVANAYLIYTTRLVARIGELLGELDVAMKYLKQADQLAERFDAEYITQSGRLASDTQTAYCLALLFGLLRSDSQIQTAKSRLDWLIRWDAFKVGTGFAGTPIILKVLAQHGMLNLAYRLLQERDCPSWLYPVTMGATTIWERWDSMLPDGSINPGQMTSFNHYALGSVCDFLHRTVGGLSPASPGWRTALVAPKPGGTIRHASTSFDSPYGLYAVKWRLEGSRMITTVNVPPNGEARVILNQVDTTVGSGEYEFDTEWNPDGDWPPTSIQGVQGNEMVCEFVP